MTLLCNLAAKIGRKGVEGDNAGLGRGREKNQSPKASLSEISADSREVFTTVPR